MASNNDGSSSLTLPRAQKEAFGLELTRIQRSMEDGGNQRVVVRLSQDDQRRIFFGQRLLRINDLQRDSAQSRYVIPQLCGRIPIGFGRALADHDEGCGI